ncbi:MAG: hypothetical protein J6T55_01130 [Alphaproteobacteria bacterium]|nr:hypothetical protein [Alphaproteobacteria bacterium]
MKKILLTSVLCLCSFAAFAEECAYAPEQEIVRSAENFKEISALGTNFDPNKKYPCGGTLPQLAVLRGNLDTLDYLQSYGADYNAMVSLKGFEIPGAPNEIPFPLFVARYAPNSPIVDVMLNSGVNFKVKDSLGHDAMWYFERNPVLRRSYLTKKGIEELIPMKERLRKLGAKI